MFNDLTHPIVDPESHVVIRTFKNTDLAGGILAMKHKYHTRMAEASVQDETGQYMLTDAFKIDTTKYDSISLDFGAGIPAGTYLLILKFYCI